LNEEENIARCIEALGWCGDVVVLDSGSADTTRARAGQLGARVFERPFDDFASQRNHALDHMEFKYDWILHLDADEVVTPELAEEIASTITDTRFDAYRIAPRLIFRGCWLRYSGMYPTYQVRLGRVTRLRFVQAGHGQRENLASECIGTLRQPYLHYGFSKGIADWIERHNRYSTDEARSALQRAGKTHGISPLFTRDSVHRRRALKQLSYRLPLRSLLRFAYMYLLRLGFLDGRAGWTYCRLMAMYEYWTVLKVRELRER
jgi:glycosyltransferase involved in cell wall biosynthesis